jgi:hypothetical protein
MRVREGRNPPSFPTIFGTTAPARRSLRAIGNAPSPDVVAAAVGRAEQAGARRLDHPAEQRGGQAAGRD